MSIEIAFMLGIIAVPLGLIALFIAYVLVDALLYGVGLAVALSRANHRCKSAPSWPLRTMAMGFWWRITGHAFASHTLTFNNGDSWSAYFKYRNKGDAK